jgi:hypothetical protein
MITANTVKINRGEHKGKSGEIDGFTGGGYGPQGEKDGTVYIKLHNTGERISIVDNEVNYSLVPFSDENVF